MTINKTSLQNRSKEERKRIAMLGGEAVAVNNSKRMKSGQASRMGKNSRKFENLVAKDLPFEKIFLPQEICDRIAVVNGQPVFIEIKHKGEKLKEKQEEFKNLVGNSFIVVEK